MNVTTGDLVEAYLDNNESLFDTVVIDVILNGELLYSFLAN